MLSFKGLLFNLAYGAIGIGYAALIGRFRHDPALAASGLSGSGLEEMVFKTAFGFFPGYFLLIFISLVIFLGVYFKFYSRKTI